MEYQPARPMSPGLQSGSDDGLHERLPGLEVLAANGDLLLPGQFQHGRDVGRQIGSPVGIGDSHRKGGVGVNHAGGDPGVVLLQSLLEAGQTGVDLAGLQEDFGAAAPDHHQAAQVVGLPELLDVLHDRLGQLALVGGSLDVASCQALDVLAAEDRLPGSDALQVGPQLFQLPGVEHPGANGRLVAGLPVNVPAAEDQVIQRSQGDEVLDQGDPFFGALAQPDRSHLGEGPDWRSLLLRMASTPAMKVDATAPIPGRRIPSLPWGSATSVPFSITVYSPIARSAQTNRNHATKSAPMAT